MPQGITFDTASGIDLTGWWSNPRTGESYRVIDQFFQDNSLYVRTDKGQILNYNVIQNMVKSDGPIETPIDRENQPKIDKSTLLDGLEDADTIEMEILNTPIKTRSKECEHSDPKYSKHKESSLDSINEKIIDKAFSKADSAPTISLGIDWNWSGLSQTLVMLKETMDIPTSEIVDYLYDRYSGKMIGNIKTILAEYVDRGGGLVNP